MQCIISLKNAEISAPTKQKAPMNFTFQLLDWFKFESFQLLSLNISNYLRRDVKECKPSRVIVHP